MNICFLDADSLGGGLSMDGFADFGTFHPYSSTAPDEVAARIRDCEIVITNKVVIPPEALAGSAVRLIAISATGANVVNLDWCREHDVAVANVAGYSTASVAQHTLVLVLGLLESIPYYDRYTKDGRYQKNPWATHLRAPYRELAGKNWGIVGLGNIGAAVARLARAFGANVLYYSTSGMNRNPNWERVSLADLLTRSDVISLHAPLNERTEGLIGAAELAQLKPDTILCNVSRGALVDEAAMADALNRGALRGYAADVFSTEPPPADHPLLAVKDPERLLMTPHMAYCSTEARETLVRELYENIAAFLAGARRNRLV